MLSKNIRPGQKSPGFRRDDVEDGLADRRIARGTLEILPCIVLSFSDMIFVRLVSDGGRKAPMNAIEIGHIGSDETRMRCNQPSLYHTPPVFCLLFTGDAVYAPAGRRYSAAARGPRPLVAPLITPGTRTAMKSHVQVAVIGGGVVGAS